MMRETWLEWLTDETRAARQTLRDAEARLVAARQEVAEANKRYSALLGRDVARAVGCKTIGMA